MGRNNDRSKLDPSVALMLHSLSKLLQITLELGPTRTRRQADMNPLAKLTMGSI